MKFTLCLTRECNMRCLYCYMGKEKRLMAPEVLKGCVEFIFSKARESDDISVCFFGGEPLMALDLLEMAMDAIEGHALYKKERTSFSIVTNGTVYDERIARLLNSRGVQLGISCDGDPGVHDLKRRMADGSPTSALVERTIRAALVDMPGLLVNAVYGPQTLGRLPQTVDYLAGLGVRRIFLSPDFSANWTRGDLETLQSVYDAIGRMYAEFYLDKRPVFINLIDNKVAVVLRKGYGPLERCTMGVGEFAFAPSGNVYPCERLIGSDDGKSHCIGNVMTGVDPGRMACGLKPEGDENAECSQCAVKSYCANWCGCSNYFASGYYNRVSAFLCASERSALSSAVNVMETIEKQLGPTFTEHLAGRPFSNALNR